MSPPLPGSPNGTPIDREMPRFQSPSKLSLRVPSKRTCPFPGPYFPYTSRSPEKSPPNRALAKKVAPFSDPSNYLLKFPVNGIPRFPNGSLRREASVSRTFLHLPSKSPVNKPPSIFSYRVPLERESSSPETMVYSFFYYNRRSPELGALPRKGENICSPSTEPHVFRSPTYNGVRPGSPKVLFTTLHSLPQCHAAFNTKPSTLAWVDQSPISQPVL